MVRDNRGIPVERLWEVLTRAGLRRSSCLRYGRLAALARAIRSYERPRPAVAADRIIDVIGDRWSGAFGQKSSAALAAARAAESAEPTAAASAAKSTTAKSTASAE